VTSTNEERELKLTVPLDWHLPADRLGSFTLGPERVIGLTATYFDTADLRLARCAASLRYREPEGWTAKLPSLRGRLMKRTEVTVIGPQTAPVPTQLLDVLTALTRGAPVGPVATLHTERRSREVRDDRGRPVAELTDDLVDAGPIGEAMVDVRQFRELEIELTEGTPDRTGRRIARVLAKTGADDRDPRSKIVRVLGPAARAPADLTDAPDVDAHSDVATLVTAAIRRSISALVAHDAQMRLTDEPDDVHDARVAVRRLRADLRTFRPVMRRDDLVAVADGLRWLGAALGEVRDADVLSANIVAASVELPEIDQIESLALQRQLADERRSAYQRLVLVLRSPDYVALLDRLVGLAAAPPIRHKYAGRDGAKEAVGLVGRPWKRLDRAVAGLTNEPDDAALHQVRIAAKKVRYASEAVQPVVGRDARRLARQLARLQDELGDYHDAALARTWLTAASAAGSADGYSAFVAGEIAHALLVRQRSIASTWRDRWDKVDARNPHHWSAD
jgi:CHAD domain-containing protein